MSWFDCHPLCDRLELNCGRHDSPPEARSRVTSHFDDEFCESEQQQRFVGCSKRLWFCSTYAHLRAASSHLADCIAFAKRSVPLFLNLKSSYCSALWHFKLLHQTLRRIFNLLWRLNLFSRDIHVCSVRNVWTYFKGIKYSMKHNIKLDVLKHAQCYFSNSN